MSVVILHSGRFVSYPRESCQVVVCYMHIHWYAHGVPFNIQVLHIFLLKLTKGTLNCSVMPLVL